MSKKKDVIRVGDIVEVLDDKFIERIGYTLTWKNFYDDMLDHPNFKDAMKLLDIDITFRPNKLIIELAHAKAISENFGGNERKIFYYPNPQECEEYLKKNDSVISYFGSEDDRYYCGPYVHFSSRYAESKVGRKFNVIEKRVAKTGKRFPPGGGDYDEYYPGGLDSGGLDDEKTHIILKLSNGFEIESIHVKKIDE